MVVGNFFSERTNWPTESNAIATVLEDFKKRSVFFIDLTQSNPTTCGFRYPESKILKSLSSKENLTYAPSAQGNLKARQAVSEYYKKHGISVPVERIFLTSSTSEGYSFIFRLLLNPSEEVLFPRPSYPLFDMLCQINDVMMKHYDFIEKESALKISEELLRHAVSPKTKAITLVNPNNPTGAYVSSQELKELNAFCQQYQLAMICDEVFLDFPVEIKHKPQSLAGNDSVLTFVLGGVSKAVALPQMKVSWIVLNGPKDLVKEAIYKLELIADTYLSVSTPAQSALPSWLSVCDDMQKQIRKRVQSNYETLKDLLKSHAQLKLYETQGGWYAVVKFRNNMDEEDIVLDLLKKDHVFVHPGYFFDFQDGNFLVLSLLTEAQAFKKGIVKIIARLIGG